MRRCAHHAHPKSEQDPLGKYVLVILGCETRHHDAENEDEGPRNHDYSWPVSIEPASNESALHSCVSATSRTRYDILTEKKKIHSCSDPIHAIVDGGKSRSWCPAYHVWNVPKAFNCPNVQNNARKAPSTVSHASHPPSGHLRSGSPAREGALLDEVRPSPHVVAVSASSCG